MKQNMKKAAVLLMTAFVLALSGCGLSDPWETWEDEGIQPADRLLPSELKETLCSAAWWKFSYEDEDFYFQFTEDGTVESNSTILRDGTSTTYYLNWDEPYAIELTIVGGGHLGYLSSGKEETFIVTSFDDAEIICTGNDTGTEITFVTTTSAEVNAMIAEKADEVAKIEAVQRIIDSGMNCGAVYSADGTFVAHYFIDLSQEENYSVRFDIISDRTLIHETSAVSVDIDSRVTLVSPVDVAGSTVSSIVINASDKTAALGSLTAYANETGAWYLGSSYGTYILKRNSEDSRCDACDAIAAELSSGYDFYKEIELSDRDNRPFFTIPNSWEDNRGYVAVYSINTPYEADGRVYFSGGTRMEMPYGGDTATWPDWTTEQYPELLSTYFSNDGVIIVKETQNNILWFLSPVGSNWFKAAR